MKDRIIYKENAGGWSWWRKSWEDEPGNPGCYYCTNRDGAGLFYVDLMHGDRIQLSGTCQFSVGGLKPESAKAKIRRWMKAEEEVK